MTRRARTRRIFVITAIAGVVLAACVPSSPAPTPTTTTTTTAPVPVACTSSQAAVSTASASEQPLSASAAQANAKREFQSATARTGNGAVPFTTVERVGGQLQISTVPVVTADQAAQVAASAASGNDLLTVEAAKPVKALGEDGGVVATATDDTYRAVQWALNSVPFESAWSTSNGTNATVAVVDTGVQSTHPDLAGQLLPGHWFFHDSNGAAQDADMDPAFDDYGHGTHVAGIVAALANNATGIAGAAPGVKILPVKVLDSQGSGWTDDVARGIDWAVANGADVINLSLGGSYSSVVSTAVSDAVTAGVMVFAAAGNGGAGGFPSYPGADAKAIAVASVTSSLTRSSFSTTGSYVDVAAPGSSITSTYPTSTYKTLSGTSMATPYAAAEGALLAAEHPGWSVAQLRERLLTTANDLGASGKDSSYGCGLIDPVEAVS